MLAEANLVGEVAKFEFDDSVSNVAIWTWLALLGAIARLFFRSLQGFFIPFLLIIPVAGAISLVRGPSPPRRILRIDRQARLITTTRSGKVNEVPVRAFRGVRIQRARIPRAGTIHQVRVLTSEGPVLVASLTSRERADEIAVWLSAWLNVKLIDDDISGLFAEFHDLKIWR